MSDNPENTEGKEPYSLDESEHAVSDARYTLKHRDVFAALDGDGGIQPGSSATGLFHADTQIVSQWHVGLPPGLKRETAEINDEHTALRLTYKDGPVEAIRDIVLHDGRLVEKIEISRLQFR